jgi:hypothetical protein
LKRNIMVLPQRKNESACSDLVKRLRAAGVSATESQIRWALKSGHVARPQLDGSLRFVFSEANVVELIDYFRSRVTTAI